MLVAIDTETTGVDLHHDARPFFVTTCFEDGTQRFWEWDVDPLTREPQVPDEDRDELLNLLTDEDATLVGQNVKFDVTALRAVLGSRFAWPWGRTEDTLVAGHLLASNQPHNLTDMAIAHLGVDVSKHENALRDATQAARRWARANRPEWRIAGPDVPGMPSATKDTWKYDTWLPRAVALEEFRDEGDPWFAVLRDYANADSAVTLALWRVMRALLRERGLWAIYRESMRLPAIHAAMEARGVTVNGAALDEQESRFRADSDEAGRCCTAMAADLGHLLELPKGASPNGNLRKFFFDVLDVPRVYSKKSKTAAPTLDKAAMQHYAETLEGVPLAFVQTLLRKRQRDTALSYMASYRRFMRPLWRDGGKYGDDERVAGWHVLHPNLNQTGTDTLRGSSNNPNEQNIKKGKDGIRGCFGPAPGREWWSMDFKNLELRLAAYKADETALIELFERPDEPPFYGSNHLLNFSIVYPDLWAEALASVGGDLALVGAWIKERWEDSWYQWDKNGWFAIQYGAGDATADLSFHKRGARALLVGKLARLLGPGGLNERQIAFARRHGYVETMPDRTVDPQRGYPLLCTRTEWGDVLPTVPLNYYIQGTACWIMRRAKVKCFEQLQAWNADGFDGHIVLDVHDEMVFDFPRGNGRWKDEPWRANLPKARRLRMLMESCGDDVGVPTPVSCEWHGESWAKGQAV